MQNHFTITFMKKLISLIYHSIYLSLVINQLGKIKIINLGKISNFKYRLYQVLDISMVRNL